MPNWSYTNYAVIGEKKEVKALYRKMKRLGDRPEPLLPNGFGKTWLGCLVKSLGTDPQKVYCRGQWSNLSLSEEGRLTFDVEHAWSRPDEVEELIRKKYPSLSIYFLEEELGMNIFQTNDLSGEYFKETVIIDDEKEGMEYFTPEKALEKLSELKGEPVTDWEQAEDFLERHNMAEDEQETEGHIWLHRAEIC